MREIDVFKLIQELRKFDSSIVSFGDAASERQISETEEHIGRALPVEYKEFVRRIVLARLTLRLH